MRQLVQDVPANEYLIIIHNREVGLESGLLTMIGNC